MGAIPEGEISGSNVDASRKYRAQNQTPKPTIWIFHQQALAF
jgi:hypothetical protein